MTPQSVTSRMKTKKGQPLRRAELNDDLKVLREDLRLFATATIKFVPYEGGVKIQFFVAENPRGETKYSEINKRGRESPDGSGFAQPFLASTQFARVADGRPVKQIVGRGLAEAAPVVVQMKDISVRMKPEIRAIVIRVFNTIESDQESTALRFRLREDLDKLGREPQLAGLARRLFKELPQT